MKRLSIFILATAMLFSTAYASDLASPGTLSSTAKVSQEASVISVSVPTGLPVTITSDGTVTTSTDAKIVNNSYGPIKVSNIQLTGTNGWSLVDNSTNFKALKVGLKKFGFKLQGAPVPVNGIASLASFNTINGGEEIPLSYSAIVAIQQLNVLEDVGNLIITIAWDKAPAVIVYGEVPANVTDYYTFTDNTATTGGWKLGLNANFKTALQANSGAGSTYKAWNPGDQLPNPGSTYQSKNVTNMAGMFYGCISNNLDLSSFSTINVINTESMFQGCKATTLELSSFNTSKVTDMECMFMYCKATTLDLRSFNTSNVTSMSFMFSQCESTTIYLSSFNTSNVTSMSNMFYYCKANSLDLSSFDTSNVSIMSNMFNNCAATSLDLSSFNTSNAVNMSNMFQNCESTIGYARTTTDADKFNATENKPVGLTFTVK